MNQPTPLSSPRKEPEQADEQRQRRWTLRTISYNVLGGHGYPRPNDKNHHDLATALTPQIPSRLALELALYRPDLITLQEAPPEPHVAQIAQALGMNYTFFPGGWPGALLTRFKIVESQNRPLVGKADELMFTRHWGRAVLDDGIRKLVVFSLHMYPHPVNAEQDHQRREVAEALAVVKKDLDAGCTVLLQGDLNQTPDVPDHQQWKNLGLVDAFEARGSGPKLSFSSHQPEKRLDYIWASHPLTAALRDCRLLYEGAFRTRPDEVWSFALSDHIPIMATFD